MVSFEICRCHFAFLQNLLRQEDYFFIFFCHLSSIVCLFLGFMLRTKMHIVLKMV